ncbi:unnamed protein product [Pleuronectes platessa]|uniref:SAP domain-containing protein n=1 Tax=Pleuronectes platessa TaxID=8262 RepID=A0A9N7TYH1_PLEPL|nr:unnamed protein product [Pleuronectes platessa]
MADDDITLDGKPLQSLRVADLKLALEQRNLPKSGQKNALVKRLKGALMLENLQRSSSSHSGLQPNSQMGEEMCQNSFIKQYLAKQQELLRQRLEREAQQEEDADESPAVPEEDEDHSEDNDCYVSEPHRPVPSQSNLTRAEERGGGASVMGHGMMGYNPDMGPSPTLHHHEPPEAAGARMQRAMGHKEPPAPSPPRAVASLSVRVLGKPDRQGLPPAVPRAQEREGTAPSEPGSAHPVLHLSRSAGVATGSHVIMDSDDDDGDDEGDDEEDWGPGPGKARMANRVPPQPQQMPPSVPLAGARSKRKLQPPQHIPPPQVHHTPMQLRHPTPPPSPPPDLFPLPDTPKQSPPDAENQEGEGSQPAPRVESVPPPTLQRQDSDSSSRSSSPDPPAKSRHGPLSLLVHEMSEDAAHSTAGSSSESPLHKLERKRQQETREMEEERHLKKEKERERQLEQERERIKAQEQEREKKRLEGEKEKERKRLEEEEKRRQKEEREKERKRLEEEKEKERKQQEDEKRREEKRLKDEQEKRQQTAKKAWVVVTEPQDSGSSSDSDSKSDSSSRSSQSSSSREKSSPARPLKKVKQGQEAEEGKNTNLSKEVEKRHLSKREVSEPTAAAVTEVEPDSERPMADQPASGAEPESSENRLEEVPMPLPLPLMVPAAYYYYYYHHHHHHHQHLLHSSYSSYNSCPAMPKCVAGT